MPIGPGAAAVDVPIADVPAHLLQDGEVVLIAVRPSGWYVLLESGPVLAIAAILAGLLFAGAQVFRIETIAPRAAAGFCVVAAGVRLATAWSQWVNRLYVLTNLRVMVVRGVSSPQVQQCLLKDVRQVLPSVSRTEKVVGVGSLTFVAQTKGQPAQIAWVHISQPADVEQIVQEALGRTK